MSKKMTTLLMMVFFITTMLFPLTVSAAPPIQITSFDATPNVVDAGRVGAILYANAAAVKTHLLTSVSVTAYRVELA